MRSKKFWIVTISVIVIVIIAILVIWGCKRQIIEGVLSQKLGTRVTIEHVNVSSSHLNVRGLEIANPKNYSTAKALRIDSIHIAYKWSDLRGTPTTIETIDVSGIHLLVECRNPICSTNNWTTLIDGIQKEKNKHKAPEVLVKSLILSDLEVDIYGMGLVPSSKKSVKIPNVEFHDIDSKKGFPTDQLIYLIFKSAGIEGYIRGLFKKNPLDFLFGSAEFKQPIEVIEN